MGSPLLPAVLLLPGVRVDEVHDLTPAPAHRGLVAPPILAETNVLPGEASLVAIRHLSGALTFHAPQNRTPLPPAQATGAGHARAVGEVHRYRIVLPAPRGPAQMGSIAATLRALVIKIAGPAIDAARDVAGQLVAKGGERLLWKARSLEPGWHRVRAGADQLALDPVSPADLGRDDRALLLLHGTFSNAASAFQGLTSGRFFAEARALYGDRIFAFNHYTISDTPEENAEDLLAALPDDGRTFDVITHSRGGLVLRDLVERAGLFGAAGARFRLGHAILVASPNAGTPLATPARWNDAFGLLANLVDLMPDAPWTTLPSLLANGLVWLATDVMPALRGISSMDAHGPTIAALQGPPVPPLDAYSALAANFEPSGNLLERLLDAGIDRFFAVANDLVVPSAGSWLVDGSAAIPAARIGCFGPGGNLTASSGTAVTHISFFAQPETTDFLLHALRREPQPWPALLPTQPLQTHRIAPPCLTGTPPERPAEREVPPSRCPREVLLARVEGRLAQPETRRRPARTRPRTTLPDGPRRCAPRILSPPRRAPSLRSGHLRAPNDRAPSTKARPCRHSKDSRLPEREALSSRCSREVLLARVERDAARTGARASSWLGGVAPVVLMSLTCRVRRLTAFLSFAGRIGIPGVFLLNMAPSPPQPPPLDGRTPFAHRGYLPHRLLPRHQFVTFRLADSLPAEMVAEWRQHIDAARHPKAEQALKARMGIAIESTLDRGIGSCRLAEDRCARLVEGALRHFDRIRYRLLAWVVMPNHVHVVIERSDEWPLDRIVRSWKCWTATSMNRECGTRGRVWQPEYFDRQIRDNAHLSRAIAYTEANPVRAGLCQSILDWRFSSARHRPDPGIASSALTP